METETDFMQRRARARARAALEASTDVLISETFRKPNNEPRPPPPGWHFSPGWQFKRQAD
jgi:hypothetical protein